MISLRWMRYETKYCPLFPRAIARPIASTIPALFLLLLLGCAHRYSEEAADWVGPRNGDFESDFSACRERMDAAPFRYGGDARLLLLDCMNDRGWHLKQRS